MKKIHMAWYHKNNRPTSGCLCNVYVNPYLTSENWEDITCKRCLAKRTKEV